jgi:hypothetical protein
VRIPHTLYIVEDREGRIMEFSSPVYQLLYSLEMQGTIKPLRGFDLMREIDIVAYIENRLQARV